MWIDGRGPRGDVRDEVRLGNSLCVGESWECCDDEGESDKRSVSALWNTPRHSDSPGNQCREWIDCGFRSHGWMLAVGTSRDLCHQERAEARPVHDVHRLGARGRVIVI